MADSETNALLEKLEDLPADVKSKLLRIISTLSESIFDAAATVAEVANTSPAAVWDVQNADEGCGVCPFEWPSVGKPSGGAYRSKSGRHSFCLAASVLFDEDVACSGELPAACPLRKGSILVVGQ